MGNFVTRGGRGGEKTSAPSHSESYKSEVFGTSKNIFFLDGRRRAVKPDDCLGRRFPQVKAEKERRPPAANGIVSGRVLRSLYFFCVSPGLNGGGDQAPPQSVSSANS